MTRLLPASAQNWREYLAEQYNETFVSPASAGGQLVSAYATALECLRAIAERARYLLLRLLVFDAADEYIFSTPLEQLDTPEAGKRYSQIFQQKMQAHPDADFAFGGY